MTPVSAKTIVLSALVTFALATQLACQSQAPAPPVATAGPTKVAAPAVPAAAPTVASAGAAPTTAVPTQAAAPPAQAAPAPIAALEPLKVGILTSITGPAARFGANAERMVRLAIDEVNAQGGAKVGSKSYRFEATTVDDRLTADGGRDGANRLVLAERVRFILGTLQAPAAGAQAITEPNKALLLAGSAIDKSLGPNFPLTLSPGMPTNRMRIPAVYDWLKKEHPGAKRIAIVVLDDSGGKDYAEAAQQQAEARGMTVVAKEFYQGDLKDFNPLVTRVLRQSPDGVDLGANSGMGPAFLGLANALYDQGYRKPFFGISADTGAMRDGGPAVDGFITAVLVDYNSPAMSAREKDVIARYKQTYKESELEAATIPIYNIALVLKQAMEKAGTIEDTAKIAQTMRDGEWDTIFGRHHFVGKKYFGLASVIEQPIYLSRRQGGKLVTTDSFKGTIE